MLLMTSGWATAWSKRVHQQLTAEIFNGLTVAERQYYTDLMQPLKLSIKGAQADLSFVGAWADNHRNESLESLFARVDERVPPALAKYKKQNTSTWHYHNIPFELNKDRCDFKNSGNLLKALLLLDESLQAGPTKSQEAILLALQIHFLQDLHQPLHTLTRVNSQCKHDRGGNLFCLEKRNKKCDLNLHQLWDRGFGVNVQHAVGGPQPQIDQDKINNKVSPQNIERWTEEAADHASFIYSIHQLDQEEYKRKAKIIVARQYSSLIQRTQDYLVEHYQRKVRGQ